MSPNREVHRQSTSAPGRGGYFAALEGLTTRPVDELLAVLADHLDVQEVPRELVGDRSLGPRITEELTRLPLYVASGPQSWGGMVVGFPGSPTELTTYAVGTPYLRRLLYPIVDLHRRLQRFRETDLPCLYLLGARFPEVLLRKFRLLGEITRHVIVLTSDLTTSLRRQRLPRLPEKRNEAWVQAHLAREMSSPEGLRIVSGSTALRLGLLATELPTVEGTRNPERLDILGFDHETHSLVAFEIKGPRAGRVELENLFLQGLEHRNWVDRNKMAIKLISDGPRGRRINTRKRTRLLIGFFGDQPPPLFHELRNAALRKDRHLRIDFLSLRWDGGGGLGCSCC